MAQNYTFGKYQIRYAAGSYWILDMAQEASGYIPPVTVNRTGMYILKKLWDGNTEEEISMDMKDEFDIDPEDAINDIRCFVNAMRDIGILQKAR